MPPQRVSRTRSPNASERARSEEPRHLELSSDGWRRVGARLGRRRDKGPRTTIPAKDGIRAGDLLDRDFTAPSLPCLGYVPPSRVIPGF